MKTYLSILLVFSFLTIQAQEIIVPLEDQLTYEDNTDTPIYFKDVNNTLDKYLGNWIFNDGTHYLKLTITKKTHIAIGWPPHYNNPNFEDFLSVTMIYKLNGVEIYNTTPVPPTDGLIYGNIINSINEIELDYDEPTQSCQRQKSARLTLRHEKNLSTGNVNLNWSRINKISYIHPLKECPDGTLVDSTEFAIPANLTLERE